MSFPDRTPQTSSGTAGLGRRAARAGAWSMAEMGAGQILRLASNLVMTRLLLPEAFGTMAMVSTVITAMTLFTDIGITQSIVRSPRGGEDHFLRAAWSVQVLRCTAIALVIAAAGLGLHVLGPQFAAAGTVYANPVLPWLIMVSSLTMVFEGLGSNAEWLAVRRMRYGRVTLLNLGSRAFSLVAMIVFGLLHPTVWALLAGMLAGSAVKAALSHIVLEGPRMAFVWDREIADELWSFGKWVLGSSSFTFVANNADRLILGGLLDAHSFGLYVIAFTWIQTVRLVIQRLSSRVGFSALSEVRHQRPEDLERVFRKFSNILDALCLGGFLAAFVGGPFLIHLLYPARYAAAGALMPLLALVILPQRFGSLGTLVLVEGDSRIMMVNSALTALLLCLGLVLGFRVFGMEGALLALTLAPLLATPVFLRRAMQILGHRIGRDLAWLGAIFAATVVVGLACHI